MTDRNEEVIRLASLGYRLIPWQGRKNINDQSRPLIQWQQTRLQPAEVAAWTRIRPDADWAVVPEETCVFDLEQKRGLDGRSDFERCLADAGLAWDSATKGCPITRTKSGGWHIWYRQPTGQRLVGGHHPRPGVECKAVNGSVHVPPSFGYTAVTSIGDVGGIPEIPSGLAQVWSSRTRRDRPDYKRDLFLDGERRLMLCAVASKLRRSLCMDESELSAALIAVRDRRCENPSTFTDDEVLAIAKDYARKPVHDLDAIALAGNAEARELCRLLARSGSYRPDTSLPPVV